jgi:hypothetical protein
MKRISSFLIFFSLIFTCSNVLKAQDETSTRSENPIFKKHILKVNLTGIALRNYGLQFEEVLNKRMSIALAYRIMPSGNIPFKTFIINQSGNSQSAGNVLNALRVGGSALTADLKFYLGKKGYGRGFYISPFYMNETFNAKGLNFDYTDFNNQTASVDLSGNLRGNTLGLMLGSQWFIGKNLCIDWWIIGPHYGKSRSVFSARTNFTLDQLEQESIRSSLASFDMPLTKESYSVSANEIKLMLDGSWAGIRAGIQFGFRF